MMANRIYRHPLIAVPLAALAVSAAAAQTCPEPLASARRLALVTADGMATAHAAMRLYERADVSLPWRAVNVSEPVLIGRKGIGWSFAFRQFARDGEPTKVDGDKKLPAGFFRIGRSFGHAASSRPGYRQLREGVVCVDAPASPAYNTITAREKVGWTISGENMWRIAAYRAGLEVDYPTSRVDRGGSCIFIHVRLPTATGTNGCVALPEPRVKALQDFSAPGAVLAVIPREAAGRFAACLPDAGSR